MRFKTPFSWIWYSPKSPLECPRIAYCVNDDLFASSLNLLDRRFNQRRSRQCLGKPNCWRDELPVFRSVNNAFQKLSMIYILRSTQCGAYLRISGEFDRERFECLRNLTRDSSFLDCGDDDVEQNNRQEILFSLNLTQTLSEGIRIDPNLAFKGASATIRQSVPEHAFEVAPFHLSIIQAFVKQNKTNPFFITSTHSAKSQACSWRSVRPYQSSLPQIMRSSTLSVLPPKHA